MISTKVIYWVYGFLYRRGSKNEQEGAVQGEAARGRKGPFIDPVFVRQRAGNPPEATSFDEQIRERLDEGKAACAAVKSGRRVRTLQKYSDRMRAAIPVSLAISLSFIFLGCLDLAMQNSVDIPFKPGVIAPTLLLTSAICFAGMIFVLPLFRGRVYVVLVSIVTAILIAGYIQGNFLNSGLGELTGDAIDWGQQKSLMAESIATWAVIFIIIMLLARFLKPLRRVLFIFVPFLIIFVQTVGLLSLMGNKPEDSSWNVSMFWNQAQEMLTIDGLHNPASEKNAIVFVLDRFDRDISDEIFADNPHFFDTLDGFTFFDDNITYASSTFPSVTGMLTGHIYQWDQSDTDYFKYAWANADLLHTLKNDGVDVRLYMDFGYSYNDSGQLKGIASNLMEGAIGINDRIALVKLLKLSAFRYAPMPAKPLFWISPTEFSDAIALTDKTSPYISNDFAFYDNITTYGLSPSADKSAFIYYHLQGPHGPLTMDENIQQVELSTPEKQAMGSMKIVYEYLRQLKALGLYDNATIIITADHGVYSPGELTKPVHAILFVKPAGSFGTPLAYSHAPVSPAQLPGTIMEGMFGNTEGFAPGYMDIKEGSDMIREYESRRGRYEITGDGRDFANWRHIGDYPADWEGKVPR